MIPKKIHYCWLSDDPLPALANKCIDSWKLQLPNYELILWDKGRFDINSVMWVKEAYDSKKYAFAADYIRLHALLTEGGIYLDLDVEVIRSFDDFLNQNSFIGFETSGNLEAAVIGSAPNCKWMINCLSYYKNRSFADSFQNNALVPLPIVLEKSLSFSGFRIPESTISQPVVLPLIKFYPSDFFSPKNNVSGEINISVRTVCVHHFDGAWVSKDLNYKMKKIIHYSLWLLFGRKLKKRIVNLIREVFGRN